MTTPVPEPLCLYHANCSDGLGAAWAMRRAIPRVELVASHYGTAPPLELAAGRHVVLADFSYKRADLLSLAAVAASVLVLDHHKSAINDLASAVTAAPNWEQHVSRVTGPNADVYRVQALFDMARSGAVIAWEFFNAGEGVPPFFLYLQDRDLWTRRLPGVDEFAMALRSYPLEVEAWDELAPLYSETPARLAHEGVPILRYHRKLVAETAAATQRGRFWLDGSPLEVRVCNAPGFMASDLGNMLAEGCDTFAAVYRDAPWGCDVSLRSSPGGTDVAAVAERFGGGGHARSAGLAVRRIADFLEILDTEETT